MTKNGKTDILVRMPDEIGVRVRAAAEERDISTHVLISKAIEYYLDNQLIPLENLAKGEE
jgi:predicted transcriptional regulator